MRENTGSPKRRELDWIGLYDCTGDATAAEKPDAPFSPPSYSKMPPVQYTNLAFHYWPTPGNIGGKGAGARLQEEVDIIY